MNLFQFMDEHFRLTFGLTAIVLIAILILLFLVVTRASIEKDGFKYKFLGFKNPFKKEDLKSLVNTVCLTTFSYNELKRIRPENIDYIVKIKKWEESYSYVVVIKTGYTSDNARLVTAGDMNILSGEKGEFRDEIDKKIINPF